MYYKNLCKNWSIVSIALLSLIFFGCSPNATTKIDRNDLVTRHNVKVTQMDTLSPLTVGNGEFAYTVDATGLQTFPDYYSNGVCLGTQSEWGWHAWPNVDDLKRSESVGYYDVQGRQVPFYVQIKHEKGRGMDATNYFRQNPHRLHLGVVGFEMKKTNGEKVAVDEITDIDQQLDLWKGVISSNFKIENNPVSVTTVGNPDQDAISSKVSSKLLENGQLKFNLRLPYPSGGHVDGAISWEHSDMHSSEIVLDEPGFKIVKHQLDTTVYYVSISSETEFDLKETSKHYFVFAPATASDDFQFSVEFSEKQPSVATEDFNATELASEKMWEAFWQSGGAIDFSGSTDERANELERRIVLSQYLTRVNCAGNYPPQETGLTMNSWYGKFHLEMHWWHGVHYALWNRIDLLEKSLDWYTKVMPKAKAKAEWQGYDGVRWAKMTDNEGNDSPSNVGEFLIWQQPHYIYFAELCYRNHPNDETLEKYAEALFATADFMADFPTWDEERGTYMLMHPLIPAQEALNKMTTYNPPYELGYWYWALSTAQAWRERMGMPKNEKWQDILDHWPSTAHKDGLYLAAESEPDSYSVEKDMHDHPMVLGSYGMVPGYGDFDAEIMRNTLDYILKNWYWETTWGWDYPMTAMCATRLDEPEKAIEGLMEPVLKNTYLNNGHNYQGERLRIYLPGNGGLLSAAAVMCVGFDGQDTEMPGIPKDGTWKVKYENLSKMP